MESCLLIWNYDPTAEEERRTRCLTIRRPIIPFRAKRRGAAALSGHQHGDDLPGPALCLHEVPPRHRPAEMGAHSARSGGIPRLFLAVWHLVLAVCRGRPGEIDRVPVHCAVPAVHARAAPLAYAAIPWVLDIPDDPDAQFYAWATQKSVAYLRFFLRMLPRDRDLYSAIMLPPCPLAGHGDFCIERDGKPEMKKNDKKYTIANAAGFIFPVTTVYMATYVIDSFQAKEYDLVVCTLFLVSCSVALTIVTGKSYTLTEQGIRHKFGDMLPRYAVERCERCHECLCADRSARRSALVGIYDHTRKHISPG